MDQGKRAANRSRYAKPNPRPKQMQTKAAYLNAALASARSVFWMSMRSPDIDAEEGGTRSVIPEPAPGKAHEETDKTHEKEEFH
jgi:hypothetical protein